MCCSSYGVFSTAAEKYLLNDETTKCSAVFYYSLLSLQAYKAVNGCCQYCCWFKPLAARVLPLVHLMTFSKKQQRTAVRFVPWLNKKPQKHKKLPPLSQPPLLAIGIWVWSILCRAKIYDLLEKCDRETHSFQWGIKALFRWLLYSDQEKYKTTFTDPQTRLHK